jgi:hypothetical protein
VSRAAVVALGAVGEGAAQACARSQIDRGAVCLGQMTVVPVAVASLPGSISIQHCVVISSPNAFPWTPDALCSSRLISRQLKILQMAKYWVRPRMGRFRRFHMHDCLR